jgi:hypothetical protein
MTKRLGLLLGAAILTLVGATPSATAQETESNAATSHTNLITANPFGYVFQWFNVEYEHKLGADKTLGFTGSYATPDDDSLGAVNAIFRFYPQGTAFKGLYLGGRTGAYYVNDFEDNGTFFGAGLEIGYTWLMGSNKNWYLGLGAGVTRIFGADGSSVIPQVRFVNFGYAF